LKAKRISEKSRKKQRGGAIDQRLVKALTHELRVEILGILNERIASPKELSDELGEGLSQVSYHVKVLRDYECIELVKTEPRRGAIEHFYRATSRAFLTDRAWYRLPDSIRPGLSADLMELIVSDAGTSLKAGVLDARKDRHMSRTPVIVDEAGWEDLMKTLDEARKRVEQIQGESSSRLRKSDEDGLTASVALLGFELVEGGKGALRLRGKKAEPKTSS
jgi:DNA-binding transcriptional ArsR family regulator